MRPPAFWQETEGRDAAFVLRALLTPLSWAYAAATAHRIATTEPFQASVPVVSIGNLTMGGTGKTPLVRLVRRLLVERGLAASCLARGYGGRLKGPVRVDVGAHTARDVGDEPMILAADGEMWVARDRPEGARAAIEAGAQALVMDDGHQNPTLQKDVRLVVVDADAGFGNGCVFPAGPLREPIVAGLKRADAVILMRSGPERVGEAVDFLPWDGPLIEAWLAPLGEAPTGPLVAFCGIGRPKKFADTLKEMGADVTDLIPFPDHHPYQNQELQRLAALAEERGARLVTTEKDAVRLPPDFRARVEIIRVETQLADPGALANLLPRRDVA